MFNSKFFTAAGLGFGLAVSSVATFSAPNAESNPQSLNSQSGHEEVFVTPFDNDHASTVEARLAALEAQMHAELAAKIAAKIGSFNFN